MRINIGGDVFINIDVIIDTDLLDRLVSRLHNAETVLQQTLKRVGDEARDEWIRNASQALKSSARYNKAVSTGSIYPSEDANTYLIKPDFKSIARTHNNKDLGLLLIVMMFFSALEFNKV